MEELQDAIEDAQYVNAIATQEEGPRPVLAWEIPTDEQLAAWEQQLRRASRKTTSKSNSGTKHRLVPFSIDWTMSRAIGFFLFSSYVKEDCDDYLRINFAEEVARWKQMKGKHRVERARKIVQVYCKPLSRDPQTGYVIYPKRTEIEEHDLSRDPPPAGSASSASSSNAASQYQVEEIERMYELNTVPAIRDSNRTGNTQYVEPHHLLTSQHFTSPPENGDIPVRPSHDGAPYTDEEYVDPALIKRLNDENRKIASTINCLGIQGPVLEEVFQTLREIDRVSAQQRRSAPIADLQPQSRRRSNDPPESSSVGDPGTKDDMISMRSQNQRYTSLRDLTDNMRQRESGNLPNSLFDKLETVVVEGLRRDYWNGFLRSDKFTKMRNFLWFQDRPVVPDDFFTMRVLGRGGFGLVTACKKGTSGKLYAMKVMNKKRIKLKKSEALAVNERKALAAVESPFVVNLKYSFHSVDDVYLILDLMTGGDLGYHLHQKGKFPKKECLYYGARIMLGLQALHDKGYVYRDLKPENCLLDEQGRVKITDLGLATRITPKLHGAAGTRGYWAPEMLRRDANGKRLPYGHTVDWFSFGCCMAEFISGGNPFRSEAALNFGLERGEETKEKAIDHATMEMEPDFPEVLFEPDAADFCRRLLDKNERTRLGTNGCEEIMAHPWFKNVNWESIISDRKRPPFVPPNDVNAASQSEIGNFTEDRQLQECVLDARDESYYKDWDWTNPHAYAAEVIEFLIYERETGEPLVPISQQSTCCCDIL